MTPLYEALLLDIGDVIMSSMWRGLDAFEAATGTVIPERGPYDPENDALWQRRVAGEIGFYDYWDTVAKRAGFADWRMLYRAVSDAVPESLVVPEAVALMQKAKRAGRRVGVLSNDAYSVNGPEFFAARPEFRDLDAFVDSTDVGVRKPAPEPYLAAAHALGVDPARIVFLDDTPECVEGARAVGMFGIHVDPLEPRPAFDLAAELLGLVPEPRARRLVRMAEEAYGAQDLEAIMRLFHPDAIVSLERREGRERSRRGASLPRRTARGSVRSARPRLRADEDAESRTGRHHRRGVAIQLPHAGWRAPILACGRGLDVARRPPDRMARVLPPS